jgi:predicted transposase YbfD/YdcC
LDVLALKGSPVTMDAMGCQRNIAFKIIEKEVGYLLAVKGNQGCLEEDAERTVRLSKPALERVEEDFGHGRIEERKCTLYREGYAAQNFSMINRIALNLIKQEQSKKRSVKGKRLDAGWNNDYLLKILIN